MKKMYLFMTCEMLDDQNECDADRKPLAWVEGDWKEYYYAHEDDILDNFEVYEWDGTSFTRVKEWDVPMEEGMAFVRVPAEAMDNRYDEDYSIKKAWVMQKWVNRTRDDSIPEIVLTASKGKNVKDRVHTSGIFSWYDVDGNYYMYTKYFDNYYVWGF